MTLQGFTSLSTQGFYLARVAGARLNCEPIVGHLVKPSKALEKW
jgi:hypothetical protein